MIDGMDGIEASLRDIPRAEWQIINATVGTRINVQLATPPSPLMANDAAFVPSARRVWITPRTCA